MENTVNYLPQGRSLSGRTFPGRWCAVRPNCLLTSWAKIGAITLGRGVVSPFVLRLLFRIGESVRENKRKRERKKAGEVEPGKRETTTRGRKDQEETLEGWKKGGYRCALSKEIERNRNLEATELTGDKNRSENMGQERSENGRKRGG